MQPVGYEFTFLCLANSRKPPSGSCIAEKRPAEQHFRRYNPENPVPEAAEKIAVGRPQPIYETP